MLAGLARNTVVERYTVERELGSGAFGTVYAARDAHSGQLVALKQLSRLSANSLSRFKHEFRAVQGLNHPHIVRLDALLEHESGWLIAMELVEGDDLLTYVRRSDNDPTFDETRLRAAFRQLAKALSGLHEHGILHRDLKPANVRVALDGRVVLLDFGLATGVASEAQSTHLGVAGTVAYMAPEQAASRVVLTAAVDLYAFGACLYEALTGSLPFRGNSPLTVMLAKQKTLPDKPSERIGAAVPADLEALCMALLATDPKGRPSLEEVQQAFAVSDFVTLTGTLTLGELDAGEVFAGREVELERIGAAHEKARSEGLRMLLVEAESGMGKSTLVAEWLKQLKQREPGALILKSQCYENEHSAFKAFDAGMETLTRRLNKLAGKDGQLSLPHHSCLLPTLFPALAAARALMKAPQQDVPADPTSALRCALIAFAKLLDSLAENESVVLVIDDMQWADPESFRLLKTISESAHAPHVLVLATVRPACELEAEIVAELELLQTRMPIERLPLQGLSKSSCEKLACSLLSGSVMAGWLDRITTESKGHPLFVSVLSRYAASHRPSLSAQLSLEAALSQKLEGLDEGARDLLEVLALAGVPCSLALVSRALGMEPEQAQKRAAKLVQAKLLRRLPHQQLACFHDRVRGIVVASLGKARTHVLHQTLADAIVQEPGYDPAVLAMHLEGTQQTQAALEAHHQAGDLALAALAFGKAEHHYGRALRLTARTEAEQSLVTTLGMQRGHALARSGRSALAALQYLETAEHAEPGQRVELRVWAAQHLLQSAQIEAGLKAAREVLAELGVPLPKSEAEALARLVWNRVCLGVGGLELPKGKPEISAAARTKLEAMWSLSAPVCAVEMMAGATLSTRHLRGSLAAGDRVHVARALATEAALSDMEQPGAPERANSLFGRARALYEAEEQPALEAWVLFSEGTAAVFRSECAVACEKLRRAEVLLRARCPEEPWLLTNVRSSLSSAWWQAGELGTHLEDVERWIAEATERDDRFAIASFETLGQGAARFLLRDDPDLARDRVNKVLAPWPREPFALVHLGELVTLHHQAMYCGGDAAWQALEAERARHARAFLLKTSFGKVLHLTRRGSAALSAYFVAGTGSLAAKYLDAARMASRVLSRSKVPMARVYSPIIDAQIAIVDGEAERALALTRTAALEAARLKYGLFDAPLSHLEGVLEGGDAGREKRERALALASAGGWKNARRFVTMDFPVIDYLAAKSR